MQLVGREFMPSSQWNSFGGMPINGFDKRRPFAGLWPALILRAVFDRFGGVFLRLRIILLEALDELAVELVAFEFAEIDGIFELFLAHNAVV